MPSSPSLTCTLEEQTGLTADELAKAREQDEILEPLAPILPPEGVVASRVRDVLARAVERETGRLDVVGVQGAARAVVAAGVARAGRRAVVVTSDIEEAWRIASDIGFLMGGAPADDVDDPADLLVFAAGELSPYAHVNPDRRAAMSRAATLFRLAHGLAWSVLVVPANGLARRVVPREEVSRPAMRIVAEEELQRDALVTWMTEAGYLRVPIVEDPGSFALRGAILDVWAPSSEAPLRIELYGDLVLSIRSFDPIDQTTHKNTPGRTEVSLPPAREAIVDRRTVARARARVTALAEAIDWPTSKTRALVEDVVSGRAFFGADAFLPAYYDGLDPLLAYVPSDAVVILDDPPSLTRALREDRIRAETDAATRASVGPHFPPSALYCDEAEIASALSSRRVLTLQRTPVSGGEGDDGLSVYESTRAPMDLASRDHDDLTRAVKASRATKGKGATLSPLVRRIAHWQGHGLRVFVTARAHTQAERLVALLGHQGVACRARLAKFEPAWLDEPGADVQVVVGSLARGVVLPGDGLVLVTEEEIFGARAHRRRERSRTADASRPFLEDLRSLASGDLVVHVEHGIGRYAGLVHKQLPGAHRDATGRTIPGLAVDLIAVEYAGGDKLYLPVWRLNQLEKYAGGDKGEAKLDKLGGSTFARTKSRVAREVRKMADELLRLYAERKAVPGDALPPVNDDYRAFEATFPFDETPDQARAIDEVNRDLESPRPMDRLVCGDVGFGKTEVALRAAYRVAMNGKQVVLLCPTTVLVQQHFRTFEARMAGAPIIVKAMSRFQTKKEQDLVNRGLRDGSVDVVVGTHRLLSKDIHFKSLGLLVVDEEHRFGVAHKERIKQLRAKVDVLTLTATPIPRTLQMAVTGLRDLSLMTTPPLDRRAVRTIVTRWDDQLVREAVQRELSRGGQCYYVYNRIDKLYEKADRLLALVPAARIAVAHGRMAESALEETMLDFVDGRYDILASTAIIESGLDIPRVNTMIVDRADLFGLAQLYQLRGRVGRSKERAYCYLVVPPQNAMTDESRSRIEALERHTDLGSGFQIAALDMELRGAGDLLGAEQSGNVASVGFDMFCRMLDEAVHEMRGDDVLHEVDPELSFDVEALLPEEYIGDVGVRLSLYKRLAGAIDESHVMDIAAEMEDRFGAPPEQATRLVKLMSLKTELRRLRVLGCEARAHLVTIHVGERTSLDSNEVAALVRKSKGAWKLTPDMRLSRRFGDGEGDGLANADRALSELAACVKDG
jgi:transcription-repair coupling factor (superfamily II helicase)